MTWTPHRCKENAVTEYEEARYTLGTRPLLSDMYDNTGRRTAAARTLDQISPGARESELRIYTRSRILGAVLHDDVLTIMVSVVVLGLHDADIYLVKA